MLGEMLGEVGEGVCRRYTLCYFWLFCLLLFGVVMSPSRLC